MDVPDPTADATHEDRPNIVLLTAHDMGRELGCYGRQAHTPRLDALAGEGALFENHFVAGPTCCPSRASLNTGLQPHNHGMLGHWVADGEVEATGRFQQPKKNWSIHGEVPTLSMWLNSRGYDTYFRGDYGLRWGESSFELVDRGARNVADAATDLLHETADDDAPFFLRATTHNAHHPFSNRESGFKDDPIPGYEGPDPDEVDLSRYFDPGSEEVHVESNDEGDVREHFADFYEDVYELDHAAGRIIDTLDETGQREDTVFVFTVDHGIPHIMAPKSKLTLYENGIESALLVHYPGRIEGGQRYDELVSNVDVLPTLLDLVDGRPPHDVDGRSARPLVDPEDPRDHEPREAVYAENNYFGYGFYTPERAIRTDRFKLVRHLWPNDYAYADRDETTEVELYDLREDPRETENVADDPAYFGVRDALYEHLRERLLRDGDPVADGPIPPRTFDTTL